MRVVIDGNDGTGKSTLVAALRNLGYAAEDRGVPTRMTDDRQAEAEDGVLYVILDAPVEVSRERLKAAGKDLEERYHTIEDLSHYRRRFREILSRLPNSAAVIDASGTHEETLERCLAAIRAAS